MHKNYGNGYVSSDIVIYIVYRQRLAIVYATYMCFGSLTNIVLRAEILNRNFLVRAPMLVSGIMVDSNEWLVYCKFVWEGVETHMELHFTIHPHP